MISENTWFLRYFAWFLASLQLMGGFYLLNLHARNLVSIASTILLWISALIAASIGFITTSPDQPWVLSFLRSALATSLPLLLPLAAITLVSLQGSARRSRYPLLYALPGYLFVILFLTIVSLDALFSTRIWLTPSSDPIHELGIATLLNTTHGSFSRLIWLISIAATPAAMLSFTIYEAWLSNKSNPSSRKTARQIFLLVFVAFSSFTSILLAGYFWTGVLVGSFLLASGLCYLSLRDYQSSGRLYPGAFQRRLFGIVNSIALPTILFSVLVAADLFRRQALAPTGNPSLTSTIDPYLVYPTIAFLVGSFLQAGLSWLVIRQGSGPLRNLATVAGAIHAGDHSQVAQVESEDELGLIARTVNYILSQSRDLTTNIERRVIERTRALEQRALQLQVAAEVARDAVAIRDHRTLLNTTVRLISDRFGFYHAGIFLIDNTQKYAVLQAASSDGGQRMLARRHQLEVGQTGLVGFVAKEGEPRIALDVGLDAIYFNNPDLPHTRSELALPLKIRGEVIGVLDVQSTKSGAFNEADISVLQILADQISLALHNAQLFQESQRAFNELAQSHKQALTRGWKNWLQNQTRAYSYQRLPFDTSTDATNILVNQDSDENSGQMQLPIHLRELQIGSLRFSTHEDQVRENKADLEMIQSALTQMALALENARLLDENRRQVQTEQILNDFSMHIQSTLDLDTVMKRSVEQVGKILGAARVAVSLAPKDSSGSSAHNGKRNEP